MNVFAYLLAGSALTGIVVLVLLFTPLGHRPLEAAFPVGDIVPTDFATLKLADRPNQYLVCPERYCRAIPNAPSPVFEVPVEELRRRWQRMVAGEPLVSLLDAQNDIQFDYVQRSARFRFPDIVTVRFIPISPSRSTLAVYSRSVYGHSDFGVNRKRIEASLEKLREALQ